MDNLTEKKENVLLKIGSFCILIGGIVAGLIGIFNGAAVMLAMTVMDDETMRTLDEYAMQESDGLFGSGDIVGRHPVHHHSQRGRHCGDRLCRHTDDHQHHRRRCGPVPL